MTQEEKAKRYDEAIGVIRKCETDKYGCIIGMKPSDIFSELRESEGEKIRKELIKHLKDGAEGYEPAGNTEDYTRWLSWVEKQGEHKRFRDSIQIGDKVTRNEAGELVNISQLARIAKPRKNKSADEVKQGEPNPTIEVKSPDEIIDACYQDNANHIIDIVTEQGNPAERSEDDMFPNLIQPDSATPAEEYSFNIESELFQELLTKRQQGLWKKEIEQAYNAGAEASWLISLKDRVQPQPKQEWSEEDSKRLQRIIDFLWYNRKGDTDTIYQQEQDIEWLKSLKNRCTWKPSDEHIHWLIWAIYRLPNAEKTNKVKTVLEDLLEQLKRLKG